MSLLYGSSISLTHYDSTLGKNVTVSTHEGIIFTNAQVDTINDFCSKNGFQFSGIAVLVQS